MYPDSGYVNLHQTPQEVTHWYRTEMVSAEHDEWEVVEVGIDGTLDGTLDQLDSGTNNSSLRRLFVDSDTQGTHIPLKRLDGGGVEATGDTNTDSVTSADGEVDTWEESDAESG